MAGAVLLLTLQAHSLMRSRLELRNSELHTHKLMATYSQADARAIKSQKENEVRELYKSLYDENFEYNGKYKDYTEIPDFQEEMDKIAAEFQDELDALNAWETTLDTELTTNSAQIEEIKAYDESYKSMLSSNIQNDYNFNQG